jgi:predicted amidohydrolase YtcJ
LDYGAWKRTKSILDRNNVQDLIGQRELNEDDLMGIFSLAVQDAVSVGLTSVHDGGLNPMSLNFFARYISKPWTYMPKI